MATLSVGSDDLFWELEASAASVPATGYWLPVCLQ